MFKSTSCSVTHMMRFLGALGTIVIALGSDLCAQGITPGSLPIELTVKPGMVLPGVKVTIGGTLPGYTGAGNVTITVTPPQAPAVSLVAKPAGGKFSTVFTETGRVGKYAIRAVAPDGKGVAVDSFSVLTPMQAAGAQQEDVKQTFNLVVTTIATTRKVALATPPSPPQQLLLQKLAEVEKRFAEASAAPDAPPAADAPAPAEAYGSALQTITDVVKQHPAAAPVVQQLLNELAPLSEELNERLPAIQKHIDGSKKLTQFCDDMVVIEETFTALTWALGITDKLKTTLFNWANSKITPAAVKLAAPEGTPDAATAALSTAAKQAVKFIAKGTPDWTKESVGLVKDLLTFLTGHVFDVYCERFQGPVDAKLVVTLNHRGKPYLKYDIRLEGKLVANFAKETGVTRIPIKGHIEGNATHFGLSENLDVLTDLVEVKTGMGRMTVMRFMPESAPYLEPLGMVVRMATPAYFNIPVTGELVGDKLTLRLQPAAIDFTPAINTGKLVMIWVLTLPPFVHVETATVPLQNAHFILARGIVDPAPQFPITVDMKKQRSVIDRHFTRDHKDAARDFRVQFDVNIKACNPTCQ